MSEPMPEARIAALRQRIIDAFPDQPDVGSHHADIDAFVRQHPPAPGGNPDMEMAVAVAGLAVAFPWFRQAVRQRAEGYFALAMRHAAGDGVEQSEAEANRWMLAAASQGHPRAQLEVGLSFYEKKSLVEAEKWFRPAADQGLIDAQYMLGCVYHLAGHHAEADRRWRQAAGQGHALAQTALGRQFHFGWGVARDYNEAARWYTTATQQGVTDAGCNLGLLFFEVNQVQEALKWWHQAAGAGHALAQYNLGNTYLHKFRNLQEAARWWGMSATQGYAEAQYQLGALHFNFGNPLEARRWLVAAAQQGHAQALQVMRTRF
jgi:TPR repeat protein